MSQMCHRECTQAIGHPIGSSRALKCNQSHSQMVGPSINIQSFLDFLFFHKSRLTMQVLPGAIQRFFGASSKFLLSGDWTHRRATISFLCFSRSGPHRSFSTHFSDPLSSFLLLLLIPVAPWMGCCCYRWPGHHQCAVLQFCFYQDV